LRNFCVEVRVALQLCSCPSSLSLSLGLPPLQVWLLPSTQPYPLICLHFWHLASKSAHTGSPPGSGPRQGRSAGTGPVTRGWWQSFFPVQSQCQNSLSPA
jgi:hypothetical protein